MITRITQAIVSLIAVLAFMVIGADVIASFNSWECTCIHNVCDWCGDRDEQEWSEFNADAFEEYESEFDALFNSYETKRAKNGRLLIRQGNCGRYSFAKMN
jgi:hypothetical protein